ncbi:unnamed protein product [Mytilus edulis]|uniref:B box-type domain-containing protein n=1 Tax=Mytilus edulis TaxID=6550 RepID=A0A8S3RL33_MYTED|nr:unnamed protein product [Mytilus edulis]
MAANWNICGVCDNLHITKQSVVWCSECDEGLCGKCKEHHAVSKSSKSHETISISEYKELPTKVLEIAQTCKLHNEKWYDGILLLSPTKIRTLKSNGSKDFVIKRFGQTFNVVNIDDGFIAVTSGGSNIINLIDTKTKKLKKTIQVHSNNDGAVYKDGHLIYCAREKGLQMISLSDESITNITYNKLSIFAYVTAFGDRLFYTNYDHHTVTCCDYHGKILWTFHDTTFLLSPLGIPVDNDGFVYVVGGKTHSVVVISPNGKSCRQLLSSDDGLNLPHVLHYDQSTNKLLVANHLDTAFLFDVRR